MPADDPVRGGVSTDIGDLIEPLAELAVEISRLRKLRPRKKSSRM